MADRFCFHRRPGAVSSLVPPLGRGAPFTAFSPVERRPIDVAQQAVETFADATPVAPAAPVATPFFGIGLGRRADVAPGPGIKEILDSLLHGLRIGTRPRAQNLRVHQCADMDVIDLKADAVIDRRWRCPWHFRGLPYGVFPRRRVPVGRYHACFSDRGLLKLSSPFVIICWRAIGDVRHAIEFGERNVQSLHLTA